MYAIFLSQKQIWSFIKPKPFFLSFQKLIWCFFFHKNIFDFSFINNFFFFLSSQKQIWFFINQIQFFSTHNNRFEFFLKNKEEDAFINKFVWFSLFHMYNISFISCIKGVHRSQESRRPDFVWVECVPNTFPFRNLTSKFSVFG